MTAEVCVNCEELIGHPVVYFDGMPYCCAGCVANGPCECTYEDELSGDASDFSANTTDVTGGVVEDAGVHLPPPQMPRSEEQMVATHEPGYDWAEADELDTLVREPIPFPRPASVPVVVHVVGFTGQRELLMFAAQMDLSGFADVALTRATASEAWFAMRAPSAGDVARVLARFRGFNLTTQVDQDMVEARITTAAPAVTIPPVPSVPVARSHQAALQSTRTDRPAEERPAAVPADDTLLPPRSRFRVFRPAAEREPQSAGVAFAAPPAEPPTRPAPQPQAAPAAVASPPPAAPRVEPNVATPVTPRTTPQPAAASAAPQADAMMERVRGEATVAPEERPGGAVTAAEHMTLVVYPFHSFAALNEFQSAVKALHGVQSTRVRRFYRGTLHLAVDYEDMIPLVERLREISGFAFSVTSETRSEIELVLDDSGAAKVGDI